jgi:hypothetical protein
MPLMTTVIDSLSSSRSPLHGKRLHSAARRRRPSPRCNSAPQSPLSLQRRIGGSSEALCHRDDRSRGWDGARVTLTGFSLPELSAFDPPVEGEGSIDPMGLAAISDRLADLLVPGLRARMRRVRFVTAVAVGALTCETLADETPADGISTPSICFEWLVIEALVRRLGSQGFPQGVPGSLKARTMVGRSQRLSAATYLKGPTVFGFNGVYKPVAVDSGVVTSGLEPGVRCAELVRRWEEEQGFDGFTDAVPGTRGGKLRSQVRDEVRSALRTGRCTTNPGSWLFGRLAASLHPDTAGLGERRALRALITDGEHETRAELARHIAEVGESLTEAQLLGAVRGRFPARLAGSLTPLLPTSDSPPWPMLPSGRCAWSPTPWARSH